MKKELHNPLFTLACVGVVVFVASVYYWLFPSISLRQIGLINIGFQIICSLGMLLLYKVFLKNFDDNLPDYFDYESNTLIAFVLVLGAAILSIINIWYITYQLRPPDIVIANFHSIFLSTSIIAILGAILGGWFTHSILIYLLALSFGSKKNFKFYYSIVGIAYCGLFFAAMMHLCYTFFALDVILDVEDIQAFLTFSRERNSISRLGEFTMLGILGYLVIRYEKLDTISKFAIAFVPTILTGITGVFVKSILHW